MPGENIYTESEIVAGCLKKDRKFQEALYKKHSRIMYGICLAYARDRASAQDMLQEGFIKVFTPSLPKRRGWGMSSFCYILFISFLEYWIFYGPINV